MNRGVTSASGALILVAALGMGTAAAVPIRDVVGYLPGSYDGERYAVVRAFAEVAPPVRVMTGCGVRVVFRVTGPTRATKRMNINACRTQVVGADWYGKAAARFRPGNHRLCVRAQTRIRIRGRLRTSSHQRCVRWKLKPPAQSLLL